MKREIETKINEWIFNDKEALLIEGARQVGKTYIIRKVLEDNNISFLEINFIERPDILDSFKKINDIHELILKMELYSSKPLIKGQSVIFLDEIQMYPEIITKIKFLVDEGSFKYILSGSLLGIEIKGIKSVPVGYLKILRMYPMNFYEFLLASGIKEDTINSLKECFDSRKAIDSIIHDKMIRLFYIYLAIGGMPQVINKFIETRNLYEVDKEQKNIIFTYKADFSRYESNDKKLKIISIYENIPSQLNKQNQKFIFTYLNKELKFDRYENSFLWLKDAGVAYPVYIANEAKAPLIISKDKNSFKLFLSDVGLLTSQYPFYFREGLIDELGKDYNNGGLFENFVAQELYSNGFIPYYFKNNKIGEIDFLIEYKNKIMPIEIKSGKEYKTHKAFDNLINKYDKSIVSPIIFSTENLFIENGILYAPIYLVGFIKQDNPVNKEIPLDIEGL